MVRFQDAVLSFCRWISEKLDGVRAYWDGSTFFSKKGIEIETEPYFKESLPSLPLDGELWAGRSSLEKVVAAINSRKSEDWEHIKYAIFDLPSSKLPYELRMEELKKLSLPQNAFVLESQQCQGIADLKQKLDQVIDQGGEGMMANGPHSFYTIGRTDSLLKVKVINFLPYLFKT